MNSRFLVFSIALVLVAPLRADITLPSVFGDNMVLQRDKPIPRVGQGSP